ncbi:MAG: NUDIX domain-containing protein [Bacteroidetes bacterium]|nr:NUDIX domain-containing protein [Bacteroidota bacterium]
MNKVFIMDRPLYLFCDKSRQATDFDFFTAYSTKEELKKSIALFEADETLKSMGILFETEKQKETALFSIFKVIEAAGGIVKNKEGKILFIFRHGKWDLPKGKIEKGEKEKEAALREVEEECGIGDLSLEEKFTITYHTYHLKGETCLKISHWYKMKYSGNSMLLIPQLEEGITDARWMNKPEIEAAMKNTFSSIFEVMKLYAAEN